MEGGRVKGVNDNKPSRQKTRQMGGRSRRCANGDAWLPTVTKKQLQLLPLSRTERKQVRAKQSERARAGRRSAAATEASDASTLQQKAATCTSAGCFLGAQSRSRLGKKGRIGEGSRNGGLKKAEDAVSSGF